MERPAVVAVGFATYHRPENLYALLPRVLGQAEQAFEILGWSFEFVVIVVDNDPLGSGRDAATATGDPRVRYVVEPRPGISSARNRALAEAADCDLLAFLDDDELPHDGWLGHLVATMLAHGADAVSGPVNSVFDAPLEPWVEASDTYLRTHRSDLVTGQRIARAATNNLLLDLRRVRELGVGFDERFGLTGGEDSFFTGQLHQRGAKLVWCAEAVVDDLVPADRANRDYNLRRRYSLSNASTRVNILLAAPGPARLRTRLASAFRGAGQLVLGSGMAIAGRLGGSLRRRAHGERYVVGGLAVLAASLGITVSPYRRKPRVS